MSTATFCRVSLHLPPNRHYLAHVLFGDDLGVVNPAGSLEWYERIDANLVWDPVENQLTRTYQLEKTGQQLIFELGVMSAGEFHRIETVARAGSLLASEQKWAPTVCRLGKVALLRDGAVSQPAVFAVAGVLFSRARRQRHPSVILDRFALLDRSLATKELDRMVYST